MIMKSNIVKYFYIMKGFSKGIWQVFGDIKEEIMAE
jgi:hypothetical protein